MNEIIPQYSFAWWLLMGAAIILGWTVAIWLQRYTEQCFTCNNTGIDPATGGPCLDCENKED